MALVPLGEQEITIQKDGNNQNIETVKQGDNIEILDYLNNHGSATINGPNDTLNGQGYYSGISNNITNQGSISNLIPGDSATDGYYDGGIVPFPDITKVDQDTGQGFGNDVTLTVNLSEKGFIFAYAVYLYGQNGTSMEGINQISIDYWGGSREVYTRTGFQEVDSGTHSATFSQTDTNNIQIAFLAGFEF